MSNKTERNLSMIDVIVFTGLESLGVCAILGNLALIIVLLRNKYLQRASFILMLNLAIADVIHGFVTTCHFYPPILLQKMHINELGIRFFNICDWTAWAITLTHMSAICIDRLIAIILYGRYNTLMTVQRIRTFSLSCWAIFLGTNITLFYLKACCMIQPLEKNRFYTFGYKTTGFNIYVLLYTPFEIITILILTFSNPITLVQLYRRHKRKLALRQQGATHSVSASSSSILKQQRSQWQRLRTTLTPSRIVLVKPNKYIASTMLLEMSMKMGSKQITNDVREMAARRANRQQQRILLQITVVALIFYIYMSAYYAVSYSSFTENSTVIIFNSYFYSITHMINPVIYFSFNKEMRAQLREALRDFIKFFSCKKKDPYGFSNASTKVNHSSKITMVAAQSTSCSETSPLFSSAQHYKSTGTTVKNLEDHDEEESVNSIDEGNSTGNESAEIRAIVEGTEPSDQCSSPQSDLYTTPPGQLPNNKMNSKDRSTFINQIVNALQYASNKSLKNVEENEMEERPRKRLDKSATTNDISSVIKQRYIRFSNTLQVFSRDSIDNLLPENRFMSMGSLERSCLLNDMSGNSDSTNENNKSAMITRSSSTSSHTMFHSAVNDETTGYLLNEDIEIDSDDEIAYL